MQNAQKPAIHMWFQLIFQFELKSLVDSNQSIARKIL